MKLHSLSRRERITSAPEFKRALDNAAIYHGKRLNLRIAQNDYGFSRIGVCLRRENFELATKRNKMRRYLKEIFRLNKSILKKGYDILAMPKRGCDNLTFAELSDEFTQIIKKANILDTT